MRFSQEIASVLPDLPDSIPWPNQKSRLSLACPARARHAGIAHRLPHADPGSAQVAARESYADTGGIPNGDQRPGHPRPLPARRDQHRDATRDAHAESVIQRQRLDDGQRERRGHDGQTYHDADSKAETEADGHHTASNGGTITNRDSSAELVSSAIGLASRACGAKGFAIVFSDRDVERESDLPLHN